MDRVARSGRLHHPYCLSCYARMERFEGASMPCERCGFVNLKLDQDLFWTKEPRFVALEAYAKIVIVFALVGLSALIVLSMGRRASYGLGQGWAVGFPILIGVLLWDLASSITRKTGDYRAAIVWRVVCAVLAPWPFLIAIDINPWARHRSMNVGPGVFAIVLLVGLLLAAGALGLGRLARAITHWRERHVLAAQERQTQPDSGAPLS